MDHEQLEQLICATINRYYRLPRHERALLEHRQKISWVIGEMRLRGQLVTPEHVERLIAELAAERKPKDLGGDR